MKLKPSDVSTVIIVNKNSESKTLQVKTRHINRLKHYAIGTLVVIIALSGTVVYLNSQNQQQQEEKKQLLVQITKLKGAITTSAPVPLIEQKKTNTAQGYIQSIEVKLQKINDYLRKRGLKGFSTKDIGGDNTAANTVSDNEKYSLYDEYLSRLVNSVAFTPMGYPRLSSITSGFGYRANPFDSESAELHPGVDFKGATGDPVRVTADGKVIFTGRKSGYGNCIIVQHKNDFETLYGHLSRINVDDGQQVKTGDVIGKVGSTGRTTGPHLHYEVRKNGKPINPVKFLTLNN